jgi:leucyl-tRNA---protein transferase
MFAQAHYPSEPLRPEELDAYLSKGWFRMGQHIFTCAYIGLDEQVYRVHWLRVLLKGFKDDKAFQKLSRLNSKFSLSIQKANITPEKEALYRNYRQCISFEPSDSLEDLLYGGSEIKIYNTLEATIYDGDKLIAVGFFDIGKESAAGISCFYDPAYKKHSLGKYLMYLKMQHCKDQEIDYFYLGYFAPGCKAFDYKLNISSRSMEYYDIGSEKWHGMAFWDATSGSIEETGQKLIAFQHELGKAGIENQLFRYSYFQVNLFRGLQGYELFDYLMLVQLFKSSPDIVNPLVVYDFRDCQYHLLHCISIGRPHEIRLHPEEYSAHILKIKTIIHSSSNIKELVEVVGKIF